MRLPLAVACVDVRCDKISVCGNFAFPDQTLTKHGIWKMTKVFIHMKK